VACPSIAYVPCAMLYVMFKCHVGWLKPSLFATWHGLGLAYVAYLMPCLDATWHGLNLAHVPCHSLASVTWHGLGVT
jgi:hypothetical protein